MFSAARFVPSLNKFTFKCVFRGKKDMSYKKKKHLQLCHEFVSLYLPTSLFLGTLNDL